MIVVGWMYLKILQNEENIEQEFVCTVIKSFKTMEVKSKSFQETNGRIKTKKNSKY